MQPAASRESFAQVTENGRTNGNGDKCGEFDAVMCSKSSSQSKRSRKASAVSFQPQLYFYVELVILKQNSIISLCIRVRAFSAELEHNIKSKS